MNIYINIHIYIYIQAVPKIYNCTYLIQLLPHRTNQYMYEDSY